MPWPRSQKESVLIQIPWNSNIPLDITPYLKGGGKCTNALKTMEFVWEMFFFLLPRLDLLNSNCDFKASAAWLRIKAQGRCSFI